MRRFKMQTFSSLTTRKSNKIYYYKVYTKLPMQFILCKSCQDEVSQRIKNKFCLQSKTSRKEHKLFIYHKFKKFFIIDFEYVFPSLSIKQSVVVRYLLGPSQRSAFSKISQRLKAVNSIHIKLHHRCLEESSIRH